MQEQMVMMKQSLLFLVLIPLLAAGSAVAAPPSKEMVTLCHKAGKKGGSTMTVPRPAAATHFGHGDSPGPCEASPSK